MHPLRWSLRAVLGSVVVLALCLAALTRPTEDVAFATGIGITVLVGAAIAAAVGGRGSLRAACGAFALVSLLVLYTNDRGRESLTLIPRFHAAAANWLNERFAWARWKGPPGKFVYWQENDAVFYVSFDRQGDFRSSGVMSMPEAYRTLRNKIDLPNLPAECPYPQRNLLHLAEIVAHVLALAAGLAGAGIAYLAHRRSETAPLQ